MLGLDDHDASLGAEHAHPDRTLLDLQAGDVIVIRRTPYRLIQARVFGWRVVDGELPEAPWRDSIHDALADADAADARHAARLSRWFTSHTALFGVV